jgi:acetyl esterase/lipase
VLHPDIQSVLDAMNATPGPPAHEVPIAEARAAYVAETSRLCGRGEPVADVRDEYVPGPGGDILVRMIRPATRDDSSAPHDASAATGAPGSSEPDDASAATGAPDSSEAHDASAATGPPGSSEPVVAFLHGGGWAMGGVESHEAALRALATSSGALVAAVEYRLAPEHPFPAGLDDSLAAVRWLARDGAPLAVAGDSAGGNLAAVVARRLRGEIPLRLQVLLYPVADAALNTPSYREFSERWGLSAASMRRFWNMYLDGRDGSEPDASPLRAADLAGVAPALVITAEADVLRDEGEAYAAALREAGVPVELERWPGTIHGFFRWLAVAAPAREVIERVGGALRRALA